MAARKQPTPPEIHPAFDAPKAPPLATPAAEGVGERGVEQGVPWYTDSAGRKFVAGGHPDAGRPW